MLFGNRLGDIAAESGRIPKGAFVCWAMQLLSVPRCRCRSTSRGGMLRCTTEAGWSSRVRRACMTMLVLQRQC